MFYLTPNKEDSTKTWINLFVSAECQQKLFLNFFFYFYINTLLLLIPFPSVHFKYCSSADVGYFIQSYMKYNRCFSAW